MDKNNIQKYLFSNSNLDTIIGRFLKQIKDVLSIE